VAGDGAQVLDAGFLGLVARVFGRLPGLYRWKVTPSSRSSVRRPSWEMSPASPSATRKSASLARLQAENGRPWSTGRDLAIFLISRRWPRVNFGGWPPLYLGYSEPNPSALKLRIHRGPGPRW
jgi:hypothetical protein